MGTTLKNKSVLCLLLFIVAISSVNRARATQYYVSPTGSSSNTGLSGSPKATLTQVWNTYGPGGTNVLVAGDVINIAAGTYLQTDRNLNIMVGITILGAGMDRTIFDNADGGTTGYFFARVASGVTLEGFKITRYGIDNTYGQAIQVEANALNVTIKDVQIDDCGRTSGKYPIEILSGSTVNIIGGGLTCNDDWESAGGMHIIGATVNITRYVFVNNYRVENGSALKVESGTVTVRNSLFSKNTISGGPRGIVYQMAGNLKIYDCLFSTNYYNYAVAQYGGTILVSGGTFYMTRSKITGTTKTSSSAAYGAAVGFDGGTGQIDSCYFETNDGGRGNDLHVRSATLTARHCTFASTSAQIGISGTSPSFTISNCGTPGEYVGAGSITKVNTNAPNYIANPLTAGYSGTCGGILLPVEVDYFAAQCLGSKLELLWSTASERDNDYFLLERANFNDEFVTIAKIKGAGTKSTPSTYSFVDEGALMNLNYYRLRQVDYNGESQTLNIIPANNTCFANSDNDDYCYYNNQLKQLVVVSTFKRHKNYQFNLVDATGKVIQSEQVFMTESSPNVNLDLDTNLSNALYFLQVTSEDNNQAFKIMLNR